MFDNKVRMVTATKSNMTAKEYEKHVGYAPVDDDLERVNCPIVNAIGHSCCGWNDCKNIPMFMGSNHEDNCNCK
jgi:hypothetical protein